MNSYLIGGLIISLALNVWTIWLLSKKPTTHNETTNEIDVNKIKYKKNADSDIVTDLNLSPKQERKAKRAERIAERKKDNEKGLKKLLK